MEARSPTSARLALAGALVALLLQPGLAVAAESVPAGPEKKPEVDFAELSLEELMDIRITSVSKREESLFHAPAAVSVITAEDIRRSGVRSLPEALRLIPGMQVAQVDASKWAVSVRGFAGRYANKLLVLVDGRSVYSSIFSGVFWETQDLLLADIERIEVIRGPGATLWGANAVNGVINIITKPPSNTQGLYVGLGAGKEERGFADARYGGRIGQKLAYRLYGKVFSRDHFANQDGSAARDGWGSARGGLSVDWDASERDQLSLHGDFYRNTADETLRFVTLVAPFYQLRDRAAKLEGEDFSGLWRHRVSPDSSFRLQVSYDRTDRDDFGGKLSEKKFDLDFQHHRSLHDQHELVWGVGYRRTRLASSETDAYFFDPAARDLNLVNVFVQDRITLARDRLYLTLGSKLEHNDFTGFEVQPSLRLLWSPAERHALWASVSRAVRSPSWGESNVNFNITAMPGPNGLPILVIFKGSDDFQSEELLAWEGGYRTQAGSHLSVDVSVFYQLYDKIRTLEPAAPFFDPDPLQPHVVAPLVFSNKSSATAYGLEVATEWRPLPDWRLNAGYAFLRLDQPGLPSEDIVADDLEGTAPEHQIQLRSRLDLPHHLELDTSAYFVDGLPAVDIPSYFRLDLRLGWQPTKDLELSVALQNALQERHQEFIDSSLGEQPTRVERGGYLSLTWQLR